jgi:hypothetical protein
MRARGLVVLGTALLSMLETREAAAAPRPAAPAGQRVAVFAGWYRPG